MAVKNIAKKNMATLSHCLIVVCQFTLVFFLSEDFWRDESSLLDRVALLNGSQENC